MHSWRITKYNPINRDEKGIYLKDEWISLYDVGSIFDNKEFTIADYKLVEDSYIKAILLLMDLNNIISMNVIGLEKFRVILKIESFHEIYSSDMRNLYKKIKTNDKLDLKELECLFRLILREHLWCKFEYADIMFVHFGYDYYMYIGSQLSNENVLESITKSGLFIESCKSPYS